MIYTYIFFLFYLLYLIYQVMIKFHYEHWNLTWNSFNILCDMFYLGFLWKMTYFLEALIVCSSVLNGWNLVVDVSWF